MFKKIDKFIKAEFDLSAVGPLMISTGKSNETDPRLPDNTFLMGYNGNESAFVIPGSSIKGVISNYVYHAVNGNEDRVKQLFGTDKPVARKSKIAFHDAYADMSTIKTSVRYSTAVDPVLGNAKQHSLNNMQAVEKGVFKAGFRLINPTNEELVLIIKALEAVNKGIVRFGGNKSRGFGAMQVDNFRMTIYSGYNDMLEPIEYAVYNSLNECSMEVCN